MNKALSCLLFTCLVGQNVYAATVAPAQDSLLNEGDPGYDVFVNDLSDPSDDGHWDGTEELDPGQEVVIEANSFIMQALRAQEGNRECAIIEPVHLGSQDARSLPHYLDTSQNTKCNNPNGVKEINDCSCPELMPNCKTDVANPTQTVYYCVKDVAAQLQSDEAQFGNGLIIGDFDIPLVGISYRESDERRLD